MLPLIMILNLLLQKGIANLEGKTPTKAQDAACLLAYVLKKSPLFLIMYPEQVIDESLQEAFLALIEKRSQGCPIAYLTGQQPFWSMELRVTSDTLIPRPETEHLVEAALEKIPTQASYQIADLGTGSGAVGLALAKERPGSQVFATDQSTAALEIAKWNAKQLAIPNIQFYQGDWCDALPSQRYDVIVSNPPYIAVTEMGLLSPEVHFEPPTALFAEEEGLKAINTILRQAPVYLKSRGWLLIEHGFSQGKKVRALFEQSGFCEVFTQKDYAGHERVTGGVFM